MDIGILAGALATALVLVSIANLNSKESKH